MSKPEDGIKAILIERKKQLAKGFDADKDDKHDHGELVYAATSYLVRNILHDKTPPGYWPWEDSQWKPEKDRIAELKKAGALIAAEIDRINRVRGRLIQ